MSQSSHIAEMLKSYIRAIDTAQIKQTQFEKTTKEYETDSIDYKKYILLAIQEQLKIVILSYKITILYSTNFKKTNSKYLLMVRKGLFFIIKTLSHFGTGYWDDPLVQSGKKYDSKNFSIATFYRIYLGTNKIFVLMFKGYITPKNLDYVTYLDMYNTFALQLKMFFPFKEYEIELQDIKSPNYKLLVSFLKLFYNICFQNFEFLQAAAAYFPKNKDYLLKGIGCLKALRAAFVLFEPDQKDKQKVENYIFYAKQKLEKLESN